MGEIFGTDGIRGTANIEPMTVETALRVGRAVGHLFRQGNDKGKVVIGKDTRLSGYMLEGALVAGICSMGSDAILLGPLPTPGISFITQNMRADAGIVISASHNPYQDNGIKVFTERGLKLSDALEEVLERLILSREIDSIRPTAQAIGKAFRVDDAVGRYIVHLKQTFPSRLSLEGMKIVLDCANGATYKVAPIVFSELGAQVKVLNNDPDGSNINLHCGSTDPEMLRQVVLENGAHAGFAFDGDGDRVIMVDEKGRVLDGDYVLAICGVSLLREKRLERNTVVGTIMSNKGLELSLLREGGSLVRTGVGDRLVFDAMQQGGYILGGEPSGHIIFSRHASTGDGIVTALQILAIMVSQERPLSELAEVLTKLPQAEKSLPVEKKPPLDKIGPIQKALREAENRLGEEGRIVLRYSGTEPKIRIMIEGPSEDSIGELMAMVEEAIVSSLR